MTNATIENKKQFTVFTDREGQTYIDNPDGKFKSLDVVVEKPTQQHQRDAQLHYNKIFKERVLGGTLLRLQIDDVLRDRNILTEERKTKAERLNKKLIEGEVRLAKGGFRKSEAYQLALDMIKARRELNSLNRERNLLDQNTAEGQAENERFSYLISQVTKVAPEGKEYFADYSDYVAKEATDIVPTLAGQHLMGLMFDFVEMQKQLPEYKFLMKYNFCDEKLRLKNKDGQFIDEDGNIVDEDGRFLNEKGEYVDNFGNRVNKDGTLYVEFQEFLD